MKHNNLRAIIVDDEPDARTELAELLKPYYNVELAGDAANLSDALLLIEQHRPDVVFLDIEMNGENGFELLDRSEYEFKTVFVTAFNQYAIRAFEVNAIDYLLKPVMPERLAKTIQKLSEQLEADKEQLSALPALTLDDRLLITLNRKMNFIKLEDIKCILAAGDYSEIVTTQNDKALVQKKMKDWEVQLPAKHFQRIHRTAIVNLDYVEKLERYGKENAIAFVKGLDKPLDISKNFLNELKTRFKV
jgi:two-component system LytT family response regulator